jgi:hypothetical protein
METMTMATMARTMKSHLLGNTMNIGTMKSSRWHPIESRPDSRFKSRDDYGGGHTV